ncbi:MAG: M43 family zinc metalloprotease [Bacteroidota bacterium]
MKNYFSLLLVLFSTCCYAQERCGFSLGDKNKQRQNPNWIRQKAEFEYQIREQQKNINGANFRVEAKVYKIPVVVHVIHNNAANVIGGDNNSNISDEQIISQIKVLNEDYRKKSGTNGYNTNAVGADMEIEFFLAYKDTLGNATNGITRTYVNVQNFDIINGNQNIAKIINWDSEKYLNIWVVRTNGATIGYSAFPYDSKLDGLDTKPTDLLSQEIFDGVIIDFHFFGTCCAVTNQTYNLGRTTTHEVGHWLGLLHPTENDTPCGNDFCDDTPQIESLNLSTNCNKISSVCSGIQRVNMIENYMDYSPDRCMNIFTNDQKTRTRAALDLSFKRKKLINSIDPLPETEKLMISVEPNPSKNSSFIRAQFKGQKDFKISVWDFKGMLMYEETYESQMSSFFAIKSDKLRSGEYIVRVVVGDETATQKIIVEK